MKEDRRPLIVVESPTKARTIGRFLGRSFGIKASSGHIMDLPKAKLGVEIEKNFEPRRFARHGESSVRDLSALEPSGRWYQPLISTREWNSGQDKQDQEA